MKCKKDNEFKEDAIMASQMSSYVKVNDNIAEWEKMEYQYLKDKNGKSGLLILIPLVLGIMKVFNYLIN